MKPQIAIPVPCHENWSKMTPVENGRFCSSCVKSVIDFTNMDDEAITDYISQNHEKKICGRFRKEQVEPLKMEIPASFLTTKMPFHRAFFFAALAVMGTSLFSCKSHGGETIGEIAVVQDTVPPVHPIDTTNSMVGIMDIPPKTIDSVPDSIGEVALPKDMPER